MPRALKLLATFAFALTLTNCGSDMIVLGPTPADQGVVIFLHADFAGASQTLNVDVSDLKKLQGPCSSGAEGEVPSWGKCISSIRVMPGWSATAYSDDDFKGRSLAITADAPNLRNVPGPCDGSFNDCVRSIRVSRQDGR
jgi:hypothetical protein